MAKSVRDVICTVVLSRDPGSLERMALSSYTRYVELRLDALEYPVERWVEGRAPRVIKALREAGVKVIATLRESSEGGSYSGGPREKLRVLSEMAWLGVDFIDVELSFPGLLELVEEARRAGSGVIASYHSLASTSYARLERALARGLRVGDIAKVVAKAASIGDNVKAFKLLRAEPGRVISFCLGELGVVSRVLAPVYGAPFTYAHHDEGAPTAPGQVSVREMEEIMEALRGWMP